VKYWQDNDNVLLLCVLWRIINIISKTKTAKRRLAMASLAEGKLTHARLFNTVKTDQPSKGQPNCSQSYSIPVAENRQPSNWRKKAASQYEWLNCEDLYWQLAAKGPGQLLQPKASPINDPNDSEDYLLLAQPSQGQPASLDSQPDNWPMKDRHVCEWIYCNCNEWPIDQWILCVKEMTNWRYINV